MSERSHDSSLEAAAPRPGSTREGVTVLVPVTERPSPLAEIYREFSRPLAQEGLPYEFVFLVEGFNAPLTEGLRELQAAGEPIRIAQLSQSVGETGLLRAGAEMARHDVLLTLPAYPRIVSDHLPEVIRPVMDDEVQICVARRWPRRDSWLNRLQNRAFHLLVRPVGGGRVSDVACGVQAMRRELLEALPLYGDFHRFLPLLALREGYSLKEVDTVQHEWDRRPRIYSPGIYLRRILDVLGLYFLVRFTEKPLRFFGLIGSVSALIGTVILIAVLVDRFAGQPIADRPMLLLGTLLVVLGVQAVALGLVGEIIVHVNAPHRRAYRIAEGARPEVEPPVTPKKTEPKAGGGEASVGSTSPGDESPANSRMPPRALSVRSEGA
ncbi:MAG: glycosyltransferase [Gemmatimonadota bacterium]